MTHAQANNPPVPSTMLQYASAYAAYPIPVHPQYVHLLNQAGEYHSHARTLRSSGMWSLILGGLLLLITAPLVLAWLATPDLPGAWIILVVAALGGVLLLSGLWLVTAPSPAGMIADGATLMLIGIVNATWFVRDRLGGEEPSYWWLFLFGFFPFLIGIGRAARYRRFALVASAAPPPVTLKWLQELRKSLRALKPELDNSGMSFRFESTNALPPVLCRGWLNGDVAVCLLNNDKLHFYTRQDMSLEALSDATTPPPADPRKKVKVKMTLAGREFNAMIPQGSLQRLLAWKTDASDADQTPGITAPATPRR